MALNFRSYSKRFNGELHFYGNASHAFYEIMVWLQKHRPRSKPNIILPVFIPAKLYRIVLAAGYIPKFYDISIGCELEADRISELIDDQTQAAFFVHYFGMPASVHELKKVMDNHDIFLIEDCAHILCGQWNGDELGTIGDCAIFSGRKMLQLPAGGFLVLNKQPWQFEPHYKSRVRSIFTACKLTQSRLKYLYFKLTRGYDPLNLAWVPGTGHINFSEEQHVKVQDISRLNKAYTHLIDLEKIVSKRRENFEYIINRLDNFSHIRPLVHINRNKKLLYKKRGRYVLRKGFTPYSLPILMPPGTRESLRKKLRNNGIGCGVGWPESPFSHKNFEQTTLLSRQLLEIPIHHGINKFQLKKIIECFQAFESANTAKSNKIFSKNNRQKAGAV